MAYLDIIDISKEFSGLTVLRDINISISEGEFLVLVGPSGCGKSTLLSMIAGLQDVSTGSINLQGKNITHTVPSERDIAMVFQSYALYPNMTVEKNITFALEMRKVPKAERKKACEDVAKTLQLSHLLNRKPRQLSGRQRQRVAMGRALVRNPRIFLFDEPLSNLDAKLRVDMRTEIKQLHQDLKTTIIYVTHDQVEAMTLADRIAVMEGGIVQQLGTSDQIYNEPANLFVASFMGSPAMNLLEVNVKSGQANIADSKAVIKTSRKDLPNGKAIMGLRPEALQEKKSPNSSAIKTKIELLEPSGPDTYLHGHIGKTPITARLRGDFHAEIGSMIELYISPEKTHFFDPDTSKRI